MAGGRAASRRVWVCPAGAGRRDGDAGQGAEPRAAEARQKRPVAACGGLTTSPAAVKPFPTAIPAPPGVQQRGAPA